MTDTPTGGTGFDPRFDPAFQPGYNPDVHGRQSPPPDYRAAQPLSRAPFSPVTETPPPPPPAIGEPPAPGTPVTVVEPMAVVEPVTGSPEVETGVADAVVARRIDPYLIALWVLSAVFVLAGVIVIRMIGDGLDKLTTSTSSPFDYQLLQVYATTAPLLIVLGLATATGTLFLLASRRARR